MSREVKRVTLDFDWFDKGTWPGYLISICSVFGEDCEKCKLFFMAAGKKGDGCSDENNLQIEPPKGPGWQMWQTVSEGSPISPVFKTPEELAQWLADTGASSFGRNTATYEQWFAMIKQGWAPSAVSTPETGIISGVVAVMELANAPRR